MNGTDLPPGRAPRVLVIDDDAGMRALLAAQLRGFGHQVRLAADGQEGLAALGQDPPDVILCDAGMPRMDGMEFLSRVKTDPGTRLIPVLMLTGSGDSETRIRALRLGSDGFLAKPADPAELEALLRNLFRTRTLTDELENAETVLFSLAEGVEAKDPYTGSHCRRLSAHGVILGKALEVPEEDLVALRRAGVLHDLGKIGIPDRILLKPGPLTPEERARPSRSPRASSRCWTPTTP